MEYKPFRVQNMIHQFRGSKFKVMVLNIINMHFRNNYGQRTFYLGLVWLNSNLGISYEVKACQNDDFRFGAKPRN